MKKLWHELCLYKLSTQQLAMLHLRLCGFRGRGWGRGGAAYIWRSGYNTLFQYHVAVLTEMLKRGWKPNLTWMQLEYRGKKASELKVEFIPNANELSAYPEHNPEWLAECLTILEK